MTRFCCWISLIRDTVNTVLFMRSCHAADFPLYCKWLYAQTWNLKSPVGLVPALLCSQLTSISYGCYHELMSSWKRSLIPWWHIHSCDMQKLWRGVWNFFFQFVKGNWLDRVSFYPKHTFFSLLPNLVFLSTKKNAIVLIAMGFISENMNGSCKHMQISCVSEFSGLSLCFHVLACCMSSSFLHLYSTLMFLFIFKHLLFSFFMEIVGISHTSLSGKHSVQMSVESRESIVLTGALIINSVFWV